MWAVFLSICLGSISIVASLYVKSELERAFNRRRKIFALHIANIWIINIVIAGSYYIFSGLFLKENGIEVVKAFSYIFLVSLEFSVPFYMIAAFLFEDWKKRQKKYTTSEDKKILYIKEKYLSKNNHYNSKTS
ncbi:hypothetical protein B0I26_11076 [Anoxybacillus vitaminiphilus]|uniref:Uncharacterized protein n=1 Tax=Paranoxybacillus vitaminiphilus TaxID=581036 RepID=A0A327YC80_9BACL|nr:hypothetical protein [Anoxybacillus vitaminiphilus]RAK18444.1 hypothetical protein B0I26_11076 [Anoxybacillus vitaminiphilus]